MEGGLEDGDLFNAENGLLDSTREERIWWAFNVLTDLFVWVVLIINSGKTLSMVCHPFQSLIVHSAEECEILMTGMGMKYCDHQR